MRFPFELRLRSLARPLAATGCVLALLGAVPRAFAAEGASSPASPTSPDSLASPTPAAPIHEQALDLLVFRPLGTARVVGGALLWVPISLIQTFMDVNKMIFELPGPPPRPDEPELVTTFDVFVRQPARDVFTRPLGQSLDDI